MRELSGKAARIKEKLAINNKVLDAETPARENDNAQEDQTSK